MIELDGGWIDADVLHLRDVWEDNLGLGGGRGGAGWGIGRRPCRRSGWEGPVVSEGSRGGAADALESCQFHQAVFQKRGRL